MAIRTSPNGVSPCLGHCPAWRHLNPDNERDPIKTLTYAYKLARVRLREREREREVA